MNLRWTSKIFSGLFAFACLSCGDNTDESTRDLTALAERGFPTAADDHLIEYRSIPGGTYGLESIIGVFRNKKGQGAVKLSVPADPNSTIKSLCEPIRNSTDQLNQEWQTDFKVNLPLRLIATGSKTDVQEQRSVNMNLRRSDTTQNICDLHLEWINPADPTRPSPIDIFYNKNSKKDGPIFHYLSSGSKYEERATVKKVDSGSILIYHAFESDLEKVVTIYRYTTKMGSQPVATPTNL